MVERRSPRVLESVIVHLASPPRVLEGMRASGSACDREAFSQRIGGCNRSFHKSSPRIGRPEKYRSCRLITVYPLSCPVWGT